MPIRSKSMQRQHLSPDEEADVRRVRAFATEFLAHLNSIESEIDQAHVHGAKSAAIQSLMTTWLTNREGVRTEVIDTLTSTRTRPDFVADLGDGKGILIEVERGGAVTNNHDLKDIWKCHLWPSTQHLFLIVPHSNWRKNGEVREKPYARTVRRVQTFFDDQRCYIDVLSAYVIGYGLEKAVTPELAAAARAADEDEVV